LFTTLYDAKVVGAVIFEDWRNDTKEKTQGKPKALLQVHQWITDIQPKKRRTEEADYEDDGPTEADQELDAYFGRSRDEDD
jgi:hypothetical protein